MIYEDAIPGLTNELLDYTEGKSMVVVGGKYANPDDIDLIRRVLELEELDWAFEDGKSGRAKDACSRILNGKYDLVVALTVCCSHPVYWSVKDAAKKAEVPLFSLMKSLTPISIVQLIGDYLKGRNRTPAYAHKKR